MRKLAIKLKFQIPLVKGDPCTNNSCDDSIGSVGSCKSNPKNKESPEKEANQRNKENHENKERTNKIHVLLALSSNTCVKRA